MDWLRRNWPDLLIGIALVAVIAGIIATLITGGSFFPVGQTSVRTTPPAQNATTTPGVTNPGATPGAGVSTPDAAAVPTTPGPSAAGASTPGASTPGADAAASNDAADAVTAAPGISVLPPEGSPSVAVADPAAAPSTPSTPSSAAGAGAQAATTTPGTSPSPRTPAADGPGDEAPYRVSVGAFGSRANAEAQAATFQAAGYPVFLAEQGSLNIVLVGPYATETEADAVAARIRAGGFGIDPVIYRFTGDADAAPAAASAAVGAPRSSTPSPAASAATPAPAADGSGRYIQVGAYGSTTSAQPQNDRLASLGYRVTERTEGDLVKLLIGPFDSARLAQVQAELDAAGIESFAR